MKGNNQHPKSVKVLTVSSLVTILNAGSYFVVVIVVADVSASWWSAAVLHCFQCPVIAPPPFRKHTYRPPSVLIGSFSVRVHVAGLNKGGMENFIDNLPGFPDNIRPSSSGGYWVAMSAVRPNPGFSMLDFLSQRPWIKKLIFKVKE